MRRIRVILFLLMLSGGLHSQEVRWTIMADPDQAASGMELPGSTADSTFGQSMNDVLADLHYGGYLSASYGISQVSDTVWEGTLYVGSLFQWATLAPGNVPEIILSRGGYRERDFTERPFSLNALQDLFDEVIEYSENHGFPFAQIWIDSVRVTDRNIRGILSYDPGPSIVFDSLRLTAFGEINTPWLMSYLDIRPGSEFSQQSLDQVPQRIRRLSFTRIADQPSLTFQNESARLYLPLERVNSNRIDGVIGFLPNEENDGGIRITGQLDLSLTNLFNSGKQLDVAWQRVKPLSQTLGIRYRHPNILRSPIHFDGSFELLKEDSTFINRQFRLALAYTSGIHEIGVFTRFKSTRLLSTGQYENATELPDFSDQNISYYGISYNLSDVSDGWSGNKGWTIDLQGAVGDKEIRRNIDIPGELYDGLDMETLQITGEFRVAHGLQLGKRSLFYARLHAGFVEDDQLFLNDLYRIGGLKTLRGFTENNFYVSSFATATVEYQLFFETYSYLFLFLDQAVLRNPISSAGRTYPTGFGLGLNLRTGGGDLQLAYALGRTEDQPVNFSLSKFHFGYIAKF